MQVKNLDNYVSFIFWTQAFMSHDGLTYCSIFFFFWLRCNHVRFIGFYYIHKAMQSSPISTSIIFSHRLRLRSLAIASGSRCLQLWLLLCVLFLWVSLFCMLRRSGITVSICMTLLVNLCHSLYETQSHLILTDRASISTTRQCYPWEELVRVSSVKIVYK